MSAPPSSMCVAQAWRNRCVAPPCRGRRTPGSACTGRRLVGAHGLAVVAQEQRLLSPASSSGRTSCRYLRQPGAGALAQRHHAVLAALALAHQQHAARSVDVVQLQAGQSRCGACRSQYSTSSMARSRRPRGVVGVGLAQHASTSAALRMRPGRRLGWLRQVQVARRVGQDVVRSRVSHLNHGSGGQVLQLHAECQAAGHRPCASRYRYRW